MSRMKRIDTCTKSRAGQEEKGKEASNEG